MCRCPHSLLRTWHKLISTQVNQRWLSAVWLTQRGLWLKVVLDPVFVHLSGKAHLSSQCGQAGDRPKVCVWSGGNADALENCYLFGRRAALLIVPFTGYVVTLLLVTIAPVCSMELSPNATASCVNEEGMAAPDCQHIWPLVSMEHYSLLSGWVISPWGSCMKVTFNKGDKDCRDKREWRIC